MASVTLNDPWVPLSLPARHHQPPGCSVNLGRPRAGLAAPTSCSPNREGWLGRPGPFPTLAIKHDLQNSLKGEEQVEAARLCVTSVAPLDTQRGCGPRAGAGSPTRRHRSRARRCQLRLGRCTGRPRVRSPEAPQGWRLARGPWRGAGAWGMQVGAGHGNGHRPPVVQATRARERGSWAGNVGPGVCDGLGHSGH